jgi:hypothetical protein
VFTRDGDYRRSGDGGLTWTDPVDLSPDLGGTPHSLAIRRFGLKTLDVLWEDGGDLWLRTSLNNGFSWGEPVLIAPNVDQADVARFGAHVTVVYVNYATYKIKVKVSTDGGQTFGAPKILGETDGYAPVISRNGRITVAWFDHLGCCPNLAMRQSTDGGATWSPRQVIAECCDGFFGQHLSMVGAGARKIIVGYNTRGEDGWPRVAVRTSFDAGAHWGDQVLLGGVYSLTPFLAYSGGVLRASYQSHPLGTNEDDVKFKTSTDFGRTWSASSIANPPTETQCYPLGVGGLGTGESVVIYLYSGDIYARTTLAE